MTSGPPNGRDVDRDALVRLRGHPTMIDGRKKRRLTRQQAIRFLADNDVAPGVLAIAAVDAAAVAVAAAHLPANQGSDPSTHTSTCQYEDFAALDSPPQAIRPQEKTAGTKSAASHECGQNEEQTTNLGKRQRRANIRTQRYESTASEGPKPREKMRPGRKTHQAKVEATLAQHLEQREFLDQVPDAPTYSPTAEEWQNPLEYIRGIQSEASKYGICIVKAPAAPAVPAALLLKNLRFTTRQQRVRQATWGADWDAGAVKFGAGTKKYSLSEFQLLADDFARKHLGMAGNVPAATVEAAFWREYGSITGAPLTVEYGNDIEGTAFCSHPSDPLGSLQWNLNTLPVLEASTLRRLQGIDAIPGVSTPMLYIGMLYATFAWHVEDCFLYSINYQHAGAAKIWYGVPASDADAFEKAAAATVFKTPCQAMKHGSTDNDGKSSDEQQRERDAVAAALIQKTTMISPKELTSRGVKVYRAVQDVGCFVITFPRSYHGGFSAGFNIGEAVNFAMDDWWPFSEDARRLYRRLQRRHILAHERALFEEGMALARKLKVLAALVGSTPPVDAPSSPPSRELAALLDARNLMMHVFVTTFDRLQRHKLDLESRGASSTSVLSSRHSAEDENDTDESWMREECGLCFQSCYLASVSLRGCAAKKLRLLPDDQRICLECAAAGRCAQHVPDMVVHQSAGWKDASVVARAFNKWLRPLHATSTLSMSGCLSFSESPRKSPSMEGCAADGHRSTGLDARVREALRDVGLIKERARRRRSHVSVAPQRTLLPTAAVDAAAHSRRPSPTERICPENGMASPAHDAAPVQVVKEEQRSVFCFAGAGRDRSEGDVAVIGSGGGGDCDDGPAIVGADVVSGEGLSKVLTAKSAAAAAHAHSRRLPQFQKLPSLVARVDSVWDALTAQETLAEQELHEWVRSATEKVQLPFLDAEQQQQQPDSIAGRWLSRLPSSGPFATSRTPSIALTPEAIEEDAIIDIVGDLFAKPSTN